AMEAPTWVSYAAFWIATLAVLLLSHHLRLRRWGKLNLPPGPKPWPIIGNLNLLGPLPHQSIHALCQKYGPIMQLRFGSYPAVVGSSIEMAEAFLKTFDVNFSERPKSIAGKHIGYNYFDITWSPYGPYWQQARKMCISELLCAKRLDFFEYVRKEEINALIKDVHKFANKPITLKEHHAAFSLNVLSRMILGKAYADPSVESVISPEEYKEMVDELFFLSGVLNIGDSIPWVGFLDLQGYIKRMKKLRKQFDKFLDHVMDEHVEKRKGVKDYVANDLVDVALQYANNPNLEVKLDRNGIKGFIVNLISGGTESSIVNVEWAISELLKKPEIFKKVTDELDRVIGRERWVEEKDIVNLPYLDAVIKESMRLHPAAPMLHRNAREDCKIAGYDIPKGTRVFVHVWGLGRDPKLWDNPNEFCPERFNGKAIDVKGQNYELLPFGSGRRVCPGYSLGLKMIQLSLANLLHGFTWKLPGDMKKEELDMEEFFGLSTPKKIPLVVVAEPRLPLHLYSEL
ncbi:Cytochrome P450, partial [Quillaja saponaria]